MEMRLMKSKGRLTALLSCAAMILLLFSGCKPQAGNGESSMTEGESDLSSSSQQTGGVQFHRFQPGTDAEKEYLVFESSPHMISQVNGSYRITDLTNYVDYKFTGPKGQAALLSVVMWCEYKIQVSTDGKKFQTVMTYTDYGRFREERVIDLTPYFQDSEEVYVRFSDAEPGDGWGGQIYDVTYMTYADEPDARMSYDISEGWQVKAEEGAAASYNAGEEYTAEGKVVFTKSFSRPAWWEGQAAALSLSWVTGKNTKVYINDVLTEPSVASGRNLVVPVPTKDEACDVEIRVETEAEDGTAGLWKSVRIGLEKAVTPPEKTWSLGGKTTKLAWNYAPYDMVTLNALAGNYLSTLLDTRFDLNGYDASIRFREQFYAHDTSRALIALADEERYSPIVRLDQIKALYEGVKSAMVPGSDYELFLQRESYPKLVRKSTTDETHLEFFSSTDRVMIYGQTYVTFRDGDGLQTPATTSYEDKEEAYSLTRRYSSAGASVSMEAVWHDGTADKATLVKTIPSDGVEEFSVVIEGLDGSFFDSRYRSISTASGPIRCSFSKEGQKIGVPDDGYLVLSQGLDMWIQNAQLITWDVKPDEIIVMASSDRQAIEKIELVYKNGTAQPSISVTPFQSVDNNRQWPFAVAENILKNGTYGANGFDPSYLCDYESLGPGALAAAAYIINKYEPGTALADESKALAKKALDAALDAYSRGNVPGIFYDKIVACDYMMRLGYAQYSEWVDTFGQVVLDQQQSDGRFTYFDARFVLTLQRCYEVTGDAEYGDAVQKYRDAVTYMPTLITYGSQTYSSHIIFAGAGDISYLAHMGDKEAVEYMMEFSATSIDDTGFFDCSDLNPYFLGWSLAGYMQKTYTLDDKKQIIHKGEYALYDENGNVDVLDHPTAYVNNPHMLQ